MKIFHRIGCPFYCSTPPSPPVREGRFLESSGRSIPAEKIRHSSPNKSISTVYVPGRIAMLGFYCPLFETGKYGLLISIHYSDDVFLLEGSRHSLSVFLTRNSVNFALDKISSRRPFVFLGDFNLHFLSRVLRNGPLPTLSSSNTFSAFNLQKKPIRSINFFSLRRFVNGSRRIRPGNVLSS